MHIGLSFFYYAVNNGLITSGKIYPIHSSKSSFYIHINFCQSHFHFYSIFISVYSSIDIAGASKGIGSSYGATVPLLVSVLMDPKISTILAPVSPSEYFN